MSKILVNFIQDRSGSMGSVWDETLNGFKKFVQDLKDGEKEDEYLFTLTTFDTQIEMPLAAKPIKDVDTSILKKHGPRGMTALYDAVGVTIKDIEDNHYGADKIIVVVVTDGHNNASREWDKESLHKAVEAKLNEGNWTFTYLGTQPETWDDAVHLGVAAGSSSTYDAHTATAAYATVACAVNNLSKSAVSGSRSMLNDFSTRSMRMAANMKTAMDDADDKKGHAQYVPIVPGPTKPKVRPPVVKKPTTKRRWN